jgi:hypothetical protein
MGSHDRFGHGRVKVGGRNVHVRRAILVARGVSLSPDQHAIALCQNPRCVNDEHLIAGTATEARAFGLHGHVGMGELFVAQQMIADGEATAEQFAICLEVSAALLIRAIAKCSWEGQAFKKAS